MPQAYLLKISRECDIPIKKAEELWDKAKTIAKESGFIEGTNEFYSYTTGILKKMIGKECTDELASESITKSDILIDLIESITDPELHMLTTFLWIRGGILGIYGPPLHPDNAYDYYALQMMHDAKILRYEVNISEDKFEKWMIELAYAIYNGYTIDQMNEINKKYNIPLIPMNIDMINVPDSFDKPFGELDFSNRELAGSRELE